MELKGKVFQILPLREGTSQSGKAWRALTVIVETLDERYPKKIAFDLFGEAIDNSPVQLGQFVTAKFDIESRDWTDSKGVTRWSTSCKAYRLEPYAPEQPAYHQPIAPQQPQGYYPPQPPQGYYQQPQAPQYPYQQYQTVAPPPAAPQAPKPQGGANDLPF